MTDLLLISNSTVYGRGYLEHVGDEIRDILGGRRAVLFFPYALHDMDSYAAKARDRFDALGFQLQSIHQFERARRKAAVLSAEAFFIGGGNTFRLLKHMGETQEERILQFLEENTTPVVGLREGSWIRQKNGTAVLEGPHQARVFRRGVAPQEVDAGTDLNRSLEPRP
jgi:dipeptidase E